MGWWLIMGTSLFWLASFDPLLSPPSFPILIICGMSALTLRPPFFPACLASSGVNWCAVPLACAALPPRLAISCLRFRLSRAMPRGAFSIALSTAPMSFGVFLSFICSNPFARFTPEPRQTGRRCRQHRQQGRAAGDDPKKVGTVSSRRHALRTRRPPSSERWQRPALAASPLLRVAKPQRSSVEN